MPYIKRQINSIILNKKKIKFITLSREVRGTSTLLNKGLGPAHFSIRVASFSNRTPDNPDRTETIDTPRSEGDHDQTLLFGIAASLTHHP